MDCFHPINLQDRIVPCGKCIACLMNKQADWVVRLNHELEVSKSAYFITLTYNDSCLPHAIVNGQKRPVLCKSDVQKWLKRLRYYYPDSGIRYFACGEYGDDSLRPHYHAIIFNFPKNEDIYKATVCSWKFGYVMVKSISRSRIAYVAKYCSPTLMSVDYIFKSKWKPFILASRRPGIGRQYVDRSEIQLRFRENPVGYDTLIGGIKSRLPRYYRDILYDSEMKEVVKEKCDKYKLKENEKRLEDICRDTSIGDTIAYIYTSEEEEARLIRKHLSKHKKSGL